MSAPSRLSLVKTRSRTAQLSTCNIPTKNLKTKYSSNTQSQRTSLNIKPKTQKKIIQAQSKGKEIKPEKCNLTCSPICPCPDAKNETPIPHIDDHNQEINESLFSTPLQQNNSTVSNPTLPDSVLREQRNALIQDNMDLRVQMDRLTAYIEQLEEELSFLKKNDVRKSQTKTVALSTVSLEQINISELQKPELNLNICVQQKINIFEANTSDKNVDREKSLKLNNCPCIDAPRKTNKSETYENPRKNSHKNRNNLKNEKQRRQYNHNPQSQVNDQNRKKRKDVGLQQTSYKKVHETQHVKQDIKAQHKSPNAQEGWLNDTDINNYYENLSPKFPDVDKHLMDPIIASILKNNPSDATKHLDALHIKEKHLIFLPINDASGTHTGSHWSLLVFNKKESKFYYFDSISSFNRKHALQMASSLCLYLNIRFNLQSFVDITCPQQQNGKDCGVFLLFFTEEILKHHKNPIQSIHYNNVSYSIQKIRHQIGRPKYQTDAFDKLTKKPIENKNIDNRNKAAHRNERQRRKSLKTMVDNFETDVVIIGDSLLRNVAITGNNVTVKCIPGLNIQKFENFIAKANTNHRVKHIILHLGTNNVKKSSPDYFIGDLWNPLSELKNKFPKAKITVSGIMKRKDVRYKHIAAFNRNYEWLTQCFDFNFIDPNTSIHYSHLARDRLHLNNYGVRAFGNFLDRTLKLLGVG